MKTVITNGTITIDFNKNVSIIANFQAAQAAGFNGGRTSFFYLVKGEVCQVKGFRMVEVEEKVEKVVTRANQNLKDVQQAVEALTNALSVMSNIEISSKDGEVYSKFRAGKNRVKVVAKEGGLFRVSVKGGVEEKLVQEYGFSVSKTRATALLSSARVNSLLVSIVAN